MTIFLSSLLLWLGEPVEAAPTAAADNPPEIVRIVSQADGIAAQKQAAAWLERSRGDMISMGQTLIRAGFKQEREDQPYPGCRAFTYGGSRALSKGQITASFVICPNRAPIALVFTNSRVFTEPGRPLPQITPPIELENKP